MKRLNREARRAQILEAALDLAATEGFGAVIQRRIAERVGLSGATVQHHTGALEEFRVEVLRAAIEARNLKAIGRAVAAGYLVEEPLRAQGLKAAFG